MATFTFSAVVQMMGSWFVTLVPSEAKDVFGKRSHVPICGVVNGIEFSTTLSPTRGGQYLLVLNKDLRKRAFISQGDELDFVIEEDFRSREPEMPEDFALVLADYPDVKAAFDGLQHSAKKYFILWINAAKTVDTREKRLAESLDKILDMARRRTRKKN